MSLSVGTGGSSAKGRSSFSSTAFRIGCSSLLVLSKGLSLSGIEVGIDRATQGLGLKVLHLQAGHHEA